MDTKLAFTIEEAVEAGAGSRTVIYEAIKARTLERFFGRSRMTSPTSSKLKLGTVGRS